MQSNFKLNHSASHLLASAIIKLYPNVRLAIGPAIEEGFYYDFDFETPILESDLPKIEKLMHKIAEQGYEIRKIENYHYDFSNQPYKKELNEQFKKENKNITFYGFVHPKTNENIFTDLCSGNHINNTKEIKYFKIYHYLIFMFPSHVITPQKQKDELGRDRTCNPQIRSLMRFHCATSPIYTSYVHPNNL